MVKIFSIEGNIGSGKSTLVDYLNRNLPILHDTRSDFTRVVYLQEPVDEWTTFVDEHRVPILTHFYQNPEKYAFSFQMMAYISRISRLRQAIRENNNNNTVIICERSVDTDKNVFAKMLYEDKKINEIDYKIYLNWFSEFTRDIPISNIIYLKTSPEVCKDRIEQRGREGENIPIEYLTRCHEYHNSWIESNTENFIIDGNEINREDNIVYDNWKNQIKVFLERQ